MGNRVKGETKATVDTRQRIIDAARTLFNSKGFHSTPTSELADTASVSVGRMYRLFPSKDDIIIAIAEENMRMRVDRLQEVFALVEDGQYTPFEAMEAIADISIIKAGAGLSFEVFAEAYRNPRVSERFNDISTIYRNGLVRLAKVARPDAKNDEIDSYVELMMACFFGLGHRALISPPTGSDKISRDMAHLIMRALGAPEENVGSKATVPTKPKRPKAVANSK